ncbi:aminoglycoside phosphotransferase family protein [Salinarimonas sp.]|uniref:aminoglycoside phosphotransferase family protein n=1 Tax=Salinarimonas sp. TaxID=2766526 RepID=UPI0032D986FA
MPAPDLLPDPDGRIAPSVERVRRLVAAQFPGYAHLPVTPVARSGWDNRTFHLGDAYSVRLPSAARYAAQVEKEHRWLAHLAAALAVPLATPVATGRPGEGYPYPWSIFRWLPGAPAEAAPPADPVAFAEDVADFLRALHRVDTTGAPAAGEHNFFRGGALSVYDGETEAALATLSRTIDVPAARALWARALASRWERPAVWVHGDVSAGNLLVDEAGRLAAVIDFGCMGVGDPACDLVLAWTFLDGPARDAFRARLDLDPETWARARGWALWKAAITLANTPGTDTAKAAEARRALDAVLAEHALA